MDQLTAYHVLGVEENASKEEIKAAYASLSKKYHPEENPEEFQRIHEAYVMLTRRSRRNHSMAVETVSLDQSTIEEKRKRDFVFCNINQSEQKAPESEKLEHEKTQFETAAFERSMRMANTQGETRQQETNIQFDFDASMQQVERQEQERIEQDTIQLLKELQELFTPPNCNKRKNFIKFFERKEYEKVFYKGQFIDALATHINEGKLKAGIYSYLIQFYKLKRVEVERLIPEAQRLYRIINSRYDIHKDIYTAAQQGGIYGVIGGGASILIKNSARILRILNKAFVGNDIIIFLVFLFCIIIISIVLCKVLRKK